MLEIIETIIDFLLANSLYIPLIFHVAKIIIKVEISKGFSDLKLDIGDAIEESGVDVCFINITMFSSIYLKPNLAIFTTNNSDAIQVGILALLIILFYYSYVIFSKQKELDNVANQEVIFLFRKRYGKEWIKIKKYYLVLLTFLFAGLGFFTILDLHEYSL